MSSGFDNPTLGELLYMRSSMVLFMVELNDLKITLLEDEMHLGWVVLE